MIKVLIIEDENGAAVRLRKILQEMNPEIQFENILDSVEAAVQWFNKNAPPDVVFMDVQLSDGICFEVFEHVQIDAPIIFTTAFDQYALKSFEQNAIDYLLKPIKRSEVERAWSKLEKYLKNTDKEDQMPKDNTSSMETSEDRFLIKVGHKLHLVKLEEILYFYSKDKITFAITHGGRRFPVNKSLEVLETELHGGDFFRINRKFIIRREAIKAMSSHTKARVKLELSPPSELDSIVSTERSPSFKKWILQTG